MAEPPPESGSPSNKSSARLSAEDRIGLYRTMTLIRELEEQVHRSYLEGLVHGTTHLCNGQEAVSAGVAKALRDDDYVSYTYRGHGQCLARGMDLEAAFAELFGRDTGVCGGLGGSMHLTDIDRGLIGAFGIVGAGLPVAVGAGVSAQLAGRKQVSVCFFGDAATNIGAFHEAMNMAQVWKLPVIFVCENNLYGEFSHILHTTPYENLVIRAAGYSMKPNWSTATTFSPYTTSQHRRSCARETATDLPSLSARPIAIGAIRAPTRPSIALKPRSRRG
jgi:acetoin:2,6-dichlorophenolindophenol oxidoreductase subunit alpha